MHRHSYSGLKLSRKRDQRQALLRSLATSLVMQEEITTTKAKAKAVLPYVERLVTKAKTGGLAQRRQVMAKLANETAVKKLFADIAPRFKDRQGGYVRLKTAGWRVQDDAPLAILSFTAKAAPKKTGDKVEAKKAANPPTGGKVTEKANAK